jgi:hypothetical protein
VGVSIALRAEFAYITSTMANISKLKLIQDKRRAISRQIVQQREVLTALEVQEHELEIAEKVLIALDAESEPELALLEPDVRLTAVDLVVGKPEGLPTMPEMILAALKDAKAKGQRGLEPKDMAAYIATKWWPGVPINAVGPIAWRMYSKDKLTKRQARYFLPKTTDESVEANAAA